MAVFLPANASRECIPRLGDFVSKTEELGSSLRNGKDFDIVEEKGSGIQKEDVVISRTRNDDVMAAEGRECSHSYGEMQTEEMVFSHGGLKGPHSCSEVPRKDMVPSQSGMKGAHVYALKGLHLYSEMPKEDMISAQNGITGTHLHHRKEPYSCIETPKEDMVSSQTASDDVVASDGADNTHTFGTEGSHSHNEMRKQDMISQSNIEISHSYGTESSHPYSKRQLSDDDVTGTENAHSHSIEGPRSCTEGQKEDIVSESGLGNTHPYGTEGSNPYVIERSHSSPDKILKKPGKLLPCPRCESLDTKFCYFNNYNVNQPRHFCRKCQRYWTAGGSLRNLPVGAGRRKNKHVSHQKHAKPSGIHMHISKSGSNEMTSGSQLSFSTSESPLSQNHASLTAMGSTSTAVDVVSNQSSLYADSTANLSTTSMYQGVVSEQSSVSDCGDAVVKWERGLTNNLQTAPIAESSTYNDAKSSIRNHQHVVMNKGLERQCFATELRYPDPTMTIESTTKEAADSNPTPVIGALPFPYVGPWQFLDSTCANMAGDNAKVVAPPNCGGWNNVPPGVWGGFPWPLIPAMWVPFGNAWNMQWNPSTFLSSGGATTPSLGMPSSLATVPMQMDGIKNSNADVSEPAQSLWVPKTLRIGDPVEAARSSIWTTLGLDDGPGLLDSGRGITNAFQCKTGGKKDAEVDESRTQSMHTNPAALSRSVTFNEKI